MSYVGSNPHILYVPLPLYLLPYTYVRTYVLGHARAVSEKMLYVFICSPCMVIFYDTKNGQGPQRTHYPPSTRKCMKSNVPVCNSTYYRVYDVILIPALTCEFYFAVAFYLLHQKRNTSYSSAERPRKYLFFLLPIEVSICQHRNKFKLVIKLLERTQKTYSGKLNDCRDLSLYSLRLDISFLTP